MIYAENGKFLLETEHTTYAFCVDQAGNLQHLYYGEKINMGVSWQNALEALKMRVFNPNGCSIIQDKTCPAVSLDDVCLEVSGRGKGDMAQPFVELFYADGSRTSDFRFKDFEIMEKQVPEELPGAYDETGKAQSLVLNMEDRNSEVRLTLIYSVLEDCDCITRFAVVKNEGSEPVTLQRLMSTQLDLRSRGRQKIVSFHGEWAREMQPCETILQSGSFQIESTTGFSSNKANPFFICGEADAKEDYGTCYGFNLIYSGNHRESIECNAHGRVRVLQGIHPDFLEKVLEEGESFSSPEAVLTFSKEGYGGISRNMHRFVREHIVRGTWKKKERPILINSWEAMYFDVKERKLLKLAKQAAAVGIELFVLDDGWFGERGNDQKALGDWQDNLEKLPDGLGGLSAKIHAMGMKFGIWVEPEMISEDSKLYREHPEYAVQIPGKAHAEGRNQLLLDLTQPEVQNRILADMSDVFTRGQVDYVKWDMNRHLSDYYSPALPKEKQGEFAHRYLLGLYRILRELTSRFPDILFEGCASGGNRFDLGMLCYMPQLWVSDCTDAVARAKIQNGCSYGYPQSVMGAHVSSCPNHQTLRVTPLHSRFAVACGGILGYECNLCDLPGEELVKIREEVAFYKKWRKVLQFGEFYRLHGLSGEGARDTDVIRWNLVSEDQEKAVGILLNGLVHANDTHRYFRSKGLDDTKQYHFYHIPQKVDIARMGDLINTASPVHIRPNSVIHQVVTHLITLEGETEEFHVPGDLLNKAGVVLSPNFGGTGFETGTALFQDFDARIYLMEAEG